VGEWVGGKDVRGKGVDLFLGVGLEIVADWREAGGVRGRAKEKDKETYRRRTSIAWRTAFWREDLEQTSWWV